MGAMRMTLIGAALSMPFLWGACDGVDPVDDTYTPQPVTIEVPDSSFPIMIENPVNPTTKEGIALGKRLYYDPIIDGLENRSCSGCHFQELSFSSGPTVLPHVNLGFDNIFLWGGGVKGTLEDAMRFEVMDFFATDVSKLNTHDEYPALFKKAFGSEEIDQEHVALALAQFLKTVNSYNSKYDQYKRGEATFTTQERHGEFIFFSEKGDCFHCHSAPLFKDNRLHNTGLNRFHNRVEDQGHFIESGDPLDSGKFKTPTLRNIGLTSPYMHDGRFATLQEVVSFYSYGVQNNSQIDPLMKKAHDGGIALDPEEMEALIAFLHTLTDESFLKNPDFAP